MDEKNPFGYPLSDYLEILLVACGAGAIKYLNTAGKFRTATFIISILTSGFSGIMTFWLLKWENSNIDGAILAFLVGVSGLMGITTWKYFEALWSKKFELMMLLMNGIKKIEQKSDDQVAHGSRLEPESLQVETTRTTNSNTNAVNPANSNNPEAA